jgi:hypothetical protein
MYYADLRLGKALSEDRLERAESTRQEAAAADHKRRLRHRLGQRLIALGGKLENDEQARAA